MAQPAQAAINLSVLAQTLLGTAMETHAFLLCTRYNKGGNLLEATKDSQLYMHMTF